MARNFAGPMAGDKLGIDNETLIAATPEQMRGILDDFTSEALRGNIPSKVFSAGLSELSRAGLEPNYTARNIRNTLKNPLASFLVNNPDLAERMARSSVGMLDQFGIDSGTASSYIGPGMDLLKQAKDDGLLRSNVTDEEVAEKIQRPLHSAIQSWMVDNRDNSKINDYLGKGAEHWVPRVGDRPINRQEAVFLDYLDPDSIFY